jgi:hypothetical protein
VDWADERPGPGRCASELNKSSNQAAYPSNLRHPIGAAPGGVSGRGYSSSIKTWETTMD